MIENKLEEKKELFDICCREIQKQVDEIEDIFKICTPEEIKEGQELQVRLENLYDQITENVYKEIEPAVKKRNWQKIEDVLGYAKKIFTGESLMDKLRSRMLNYESRSAMMNCFILDDCRGVIDQYFAWMREQGKKAPLKRELLPLPTKEEYQKMSTTLGGLSLKLTEKIITEMYELCEVGNAQ